MKLTREEEQVLGAIGGLCKGKPATPVTISAIHHTFSDMDVSTLVRHLGILLDNGLIRNARPTTEKLGNTYVITSEGMDEYHRTTANRS
jgi:hypothetical protein